jgi:hypothetical protein
MRESVIEKYLVKQVKAVGGEVRKVQWVGRRGAPDRVVMLPSKRMAQTIDCAWCNPQGLTVWVELKAPGVEPEPHQLREHKRMRLVGQTVLVIDSLEGVDELLRGYK